MLTIALLLLLALLASYRFVPPARETVREAAAPLVPGRRTVADVMHALQLRVEPKMRDLCGRAGVAFPPPGLTLLAIKDERRLEVWAERDGAWRHLVDYPFTAFSGTLGPKCREGDGQIPEGLYRLDNLNPNSSYHLSMRVNYPNEFDRRMARSERRTHLGGDIFIHGRDASIGCIAIGDPAIEELFYLVAATGREKVEVIIAPRDLRAARVEPLPTSPVWVADLYTVIRQAMARYPHAP